MRPRTATSGTTKQRMEVTREKFGNRVAESITPNELQDWLEEMVEECDWSNATFKKGTGQPCRRRSKSGSESESDQQPGAVGAAEIRSGGQAPVLDR